MDHYKQLLENFSQIEACIGYAFKNKKLLTLAFIHSSFYHENREIVEGHNERLEFLGDAVFGLIISNYLHETLFYHSEGELSHIRSRVIEASTCAFFVEKLCIGNYLLLGKGERRGGKRGRETILADFFEALLGAIFLDGGLTEVHSFFFRHFTDDVQRVIEAPTRNWKAELQDYSQKRYQRPPQYRILSESGPDHNKLFHVGVYIDEQQFGSGQGSSKKEAEILSAEQAIQKIEAL